MIRASFLVAAACLLLLAACGPDDTASQAVEPPPRASAAPSFSAPEVTATDLPPTTPADVTPAVQALTRALQSGDASQLSSLLGTTLWLAQANNETEGESLSREAGIAWLKGHWGRPTIVESSYIRDGALLSIATSGWLARDPLEQGELLFNLHRYDSSGSMNDLTGQWQIDTILYR